MVPAEAGIQNDGRNVAERAVSGPPPPRGTDKWAENRSRLAVSRSVQHGLNVAMISPTLTISSRYGRLCPAHSHRRLVHVCRLLLFLPYANRAVRSGKNDCPEWPAGPSRPRPQRQPRTPAAEAGAGIRDGRTAVHYRVDGWLAPPRLRWHGSSPRRTVAPGDAGEQAPPPLSRQAPSPAAPSASLTELHSPLRRDFLL